MKQLTSNYGIQIVVLLVSIIVLAVMFPSFANVSSVFGSLSLFVSIGLVALGVSVTMIAGELDMSVASMAALSGIVAVQIASLVPGSIGLLPSLLIPTVIGAGFGALQGYAIYRLKINSLVFTVGTLILLRGIAFIVSGNAPVSLTTYDASDILSERWGFLSPGILIALLIFVAIGLYLAKVRGGREIYAIGGARTEAIAAGVSLRKTIVFSFAISGGCAALAGALVCIRNASASPIAFNDLLVQAISAALIGGISLYGGRGNVINVVLGIGIVAVLSAGLSAGGIQPYVTTLVVGILLFVLIAVEFVRHYFARRSHYAHLARPTAILEKESVLS